MGTTVHSYRNVNSAFENLKVLALQDQWRRIAPRGTATMEWRGPFITEYQQPTERVLFSSVRDANPFFHFFEALWILDGRDDVAYLAQFNSAIAQFSDNGSTFHAPYGKRLRYHFGSVGGVQYTDQLIEAVKILRRDHDSRQVVLSIWDPKEDLGAKTKDVPCNDLLMVKIRDGSLNLTVSCRSNDAIWGCYGANVVQFSTIHEFLARAIGVEIGTYVQISDSFHIYCERDDWKRISAAPFDLSEDRYCNSTKPCVSPFPLMHHNTSYTSWLLQLKLFTHNRLHEYRNDIDPFFTHVAVPMLRAWLTYKGTPTDKNSRIELAKSCLYECYATDWRVACSAWLDRRRET